MRNSDGTNTITVKAPAGASLSSYFQPRGAPPANAINNRAPAFDAVLGGDGRFRFSDFTNLVPPGKPGSQG